MTPFSAFYNFVLPELPGIGQNLALFTLRNIAIDFCTDTLIHVADLTPIDIVAGTATYDLNSPVNETEVTMIKAAWFNDAQLANVTLDTLNSGPSNWSLVSADRSAAYTQLSTDTVTLYPNPNFSSVGGLKIQAALRPTRQASGLTDWLANDYFEVIAAGAMGRLMLQAGKPWMNQELGVHYTSIYESAKTNAAIDANRSLTRAVLSVRMRPAC